MQPLRIELVNFRQYKKEETYFPESGLIGIVGKNGAGKSTLFNAIGWALYGQINDITKDDIKNQQAGKNESCYVEFDFLYNGKFYRIHRNLVTKKTQVEINGVVKHIETKPVNEFIEKELFKMDFKAFSVCYYALQDEFDALAKAKPAERAKIISKLLRIESIDEAAKKARDDLREYEREIAETKKYLLNADELKEEKASILRSIRLCEKDLKQLNQSLKKTEDRYKDVLVQKAEGDKTYETYRSLHVDMEKCDSSIEGLETRTLKGLIAKLDHLNSLKKRLQEIKPYKTKVDELQDKKDALAKRENKFNEKGKLQQNMASLMDDVKSYSNEYSLLKEELTKLGDVAASIGTCETSISKNQDETTSFVDRMSNLKATISFQKQKMDELKNMRDTFDELGDESPCPTCERPLGEHYEDKMDHIKKEVEKIKQEVAPLQEEGRKLGEKKKENEKHLKELKAELARLREKETTKNKKSERLSVIEKEVKVRKNNYEKMKEEFQPLKDITFDRDDFQAILNELKEAKKYYEEILGIETSLKEEPSLLKEKKEVEKDLNDLKTKRDRLKNEIETLKFDEKAYRSLFDESELLLEQLNQIKEKRFKTESDQNVLETKRDALLEKEKENDKKLATINTKEKEISFLSTLDTLYKGYKKDKLAKIAPALSSLISDFMDIVTEGKYTNVKLDDKYNIFMTENGNENPLHFYSGGNRKLAALCQRLAVSQMLVSQTGLARFNMLAMDEVFGSMDNDRQDNLVDMLKNLNEVFPQILIVTHSENVKNLFDYVLEVSIDAKGYSTLSWENDWDKSETETLIESYYDTE